MQTFATLNVAIGGRRRGRFVVGDVRYPESPHEPVVFMLERVRRLPSLLSTA